MKNWKRIGTLLVLFVLIVTTNVKAQSNSKEIVIIRTTETFSPASGRINPELVVVEPDGKKYILPLKKGSSTSFGEDAGENGITIQTEILKWSEIGFEITSFSTDGGEAFTRTFIIMTRETN